MEINDHAETQEVTYLTDLSNDCLNAIAAVCVGVSSPETACTTLASLSLSCKAFRVEVEERLASHWKQLGAECYPESQTADGGNGCGLVGDVGWRFTRQHNNGRLCNNTIRCFRLTSRKDSLKPI